MFQWLQIRQISTTCDSWNAVQSHFSQHMRHAHNHRHSYSITHMQEISDFLSQYLFHSLHVKRKKYIILTCQNFTNSKKHAFYNTVWRKRRKHYNRGISPKAHCQRKYSTCESTNQSRLCEIGWTLPPCPTVKKDANKWCFVLYLLTLCCLRTLELDFWTSSQAADILLCLCPVDLALSTFFTWSLLSNS